jgi:hypothetical protein
MDTLRFQWTKWVIEYDLASQLSLFRDVGHAIKEAASAVKEAVTTAWRWLKGHLWVGGLAIAAIVTVVFLRRRRGGPRSLETGKTRPRKRSPIAHTFDQVAKQLARAGVSRDAATTPRELAKRVTFATLEVSELVDLYYAAEWGGRRDPDDERRAGELAKKIADEVTQLLRRKRAA